MPANSEMPQLQNEVQQIKNNLSALQGLSDQARQSAQSAGKKIRDVEKQNVDDVFDKKFKSIARRASRSFTTALENLIVNGDSFKTVFKKLGVDLLKSFIGSQVLNQVPRAVLPFARGGVLGGPTFFPLKRRIGLAGEAGPEAILPLARGADGRLGVRAQNGGGGRAVNISVNIATPDPQAFRRTQTQLAGMLRRAVAYGQRNS